MCASDGNKVLWISEFGFVPGCCRGEHHAPPVALSLPADRDNMCVAVSSLSPLGCGSFWQHRKPTEVTYACGELVTPVEYRDAILQDFSMLRPLQLLSWGSQFFLVCRMRVGKCGLADCPLNNAKLPKLEQEFKQSEVLSQWETEQTAVLLILRSINSFTSLVLTQAPSWPATLLSDQEKRFLPWALLHLCLISDGHIFH